MITYLIIIILVLIDFFTKKIALNSLTHEITIFGDYLKLKLVNNTGIAFSMPLSGLILKIITVVLIILIGYYYHKHEQKKQLRILNLSYVLILGGAIGNGIDRIFNGSVIDFVSVKYFAIFNFADIFISVGTILLLFYYLQISWKNKK